jgi:1-acyl-sn-glycerol-3-phosphate acyltransferase
MYVVTHLFVFIYLPLALLISLVDKSRIPSLKQWFLRCLFGIVGKELEISGYENVKPNHTYIIISNYPSFYAGFSLIGVFPEASIVAHAFTRRVPLLGWALRRVGAIFVQPGRAGKGMKAIDMGLSEQDELASVIILPEGQRTPDGKIQRFRRGFVRILRQTSLDLLPVTMNGMYQLKPVRRFYLDPGAEPELIIHTPIPNTTLRQMSDGEILTTVKEVIGSVYQS